MKRPSEIASQPLVPGMASTSTPLADVQYYQPGSALALAILLLPVVVTLAVAAVALGGAGRVPLWLAFLPLLWLPLLPVLVLVMQSARTSPTGIAVGRPWRRWTELAWPEIEHVDVRGPALAIVGRGRRIRIVPALLRDGTRLRRELVLRLPPHALSVELSREAEQIVSSDCFVTPEGEIQGVLIARPRARYPLGAALLGLILAALAVLAAFVLDPGLGLALALILAAGAAACFALTYWLRQRLVVDAAGIAVAYPGVRPASLTWSSLVLVEYTPGETLLRLRATDAQTTRKHRCPGPAMLTTAQGEWLRTFLETYCRARGTPVVTRRRLL
ncbi:MAG TPA: hypothetical protein VFU88_18290 [Ktedonobacterales bacterium]|nr:hypothetical protein [Ktedonobacterales bacterium]